MEALASMEQKYTKLLAAKWSQPRASNPALAFFFVQQGVKPGTVRAAVFFVLNLWNINFDSVKATTTSITWQHFENMPCFIITWFSKTLLSYFRVKYTVASYHLATLTCAFAEETWLKTELHLLYFTFIYIFIGLSSHLLCEAMNLMYLCVKGVPTVGNKLEPTVCCCMLWTIS